MSYSQPRNKVNTAFTAHWRSFNNESGESDRHVSTIRSPADVTEFVGLVSRKASGAMTMHHHRWLDSEKTGQVLCAVMLETKHPDQVWGFLGYQNKSFEYYGSIGDPAAGGVSCGQDFDQGTALTLDEFTAALIEFLETADRPACVCWQPGEYRDPRAWQRGPSGSFVALWRSMRKSSPTAQQYLSVDKPGDIDTLVQQLRDPNAGIDTLFHRDRAPEDSVYGWPDHQLSVCFWDERGYLFYRRESVNPDKSREFSLAHSLSLSDTIQALMQFLITAEQPALDWVDTSDLLQPLITRPVITMSWYEPDADDRFHLRQCTVSSPAEVREQLSVLLNKDDVEIELCHEGLPWKYVRWLDGQILQDHHVEIAHWHGYTYLTFDGWYSVGDPDSPEFHSYSQMYYEPGTGLSDNKLVIDAVAEFLATAKRPNRIPWRLSR